jgi:hypothetical protein
MVTLYTHGQLAAKLVVEGALDQMAGKAQGKFPVVAVTIDEGRRAKLGCKPGGTTLYYEILEKSGVFLDLTGSTTTVWFRDADGRDALQSFEVLLKRAYPEAKQVEDKPGAADETTRQRSYDVPIGGGRVAVVDIVYPAEGTVPRSFFARIQAYARGQGQKN